MGKPYESEVAALADTYRWAIAEDVSRYAQALRRVIDRPLLAVGSGGSLTAAHLIAGLHEHYTGSVARSLTPLDIVGTARRLDRAGVLFVSAGGSNPDVVDAFRLVAEQEPHSTLILSGRAESALARAAREYRGVDFIGVSLPTAKDGYLATNSLLAFAVLTWRAYADVLGNSHTVPPTIGALLGADIESYRAKLATLVAPLWMRSSLVLLHGADTAAAGLDIESRFVEAALGHVNVADFRNFAHGRHQWLARYLKEVAVLTLETPRDASLGRSTTSLLPRSIPVARLSVAGSGAHAAVGAVVTAILLAAEAGRARGIDPGRPKVPEFGRRLYRSRGLRTLAASLTGEEKRAGRGATRSWAAVRKGRVAGAGVLLRTAADAASADDRLGVPDWRVLVDEAAERLVSATYRGAVFDYDGTLCDVADRYRGLSDAVISGVSSLLAKNIPVGIATGRGRSVHAALRAAIASRHWARVLIGYYNGAEIRTLAAGAPSTDQVIVDESLGAAYDALSADRRVQTQCQLTARATQVTLELAAGARESELWDVVSEVIAGATPMRLGVVRSSHSIDVLAPGVTKRNVVTRLDEMAGGGEILCVGDRGRFPGNDFELLATPYGLSVDEVSGAPDSCWNLAPPGVTGVAATAYYFSRFRFRNSTFQIAGF